MAKEESKQILQEKLEFLLAEQAKTANPLQKFELKKAIEEVEDQLKHCTSGTFDIDLSRLPKPATNQFIGRSDELATLHQAFNKRA